MQSSRWMWLPLVLAAPAWGQIKLGGSANVKVKGKVEAPKIDVKATTSVKGGATAKADVHAKAEAAAKTEAAAKAEAAAKVGATGKADADVAGGAAAAGGKTEAKGSIELVLKTLDLPRLAAEARAGGVTEADLKIAIGAFRAKKMPAAEAHAVLKDEIAACKKHGPVDNFGAFVQAKLDAGLRGRELAAAIHAEHRARGKGKPGGPGEKDKGKPEDAGEKAKGKPEGVGEKAKGTPEGAGEKGKGKSKGEDDEGEHEGHGKKRDIDPAGEKFKGGRR